MMNEQQRRERIRNELGFLCDDEAELLALTDLMEAMTDVIADIKLFSKRIMDTQALKLKSRLALIFTFMSGVKREVIQFERVTDTDLS